MDSMTKRTSLLLLLECEVLVVEFNSLLLGLLVVDGICTGCATDERQPSALKFCVERFLFDGRSAEGQTNLLVLKAFWLCYVAERRNRVKWLRRVEEK